MVNFTEQSRTVKIEKSIGNFTVFSFAWSVGFLPDISIKSPSGCYYTNKLASNLPLCQSEQIHTINSQFQTITFEIPGTAKVHRM